MKRAAVIALLLLAIPAARAAADVIAQRGPITLSADDVRQLLTALDPAARDKLQHDPAAMANLVRDRIAQLMLLQEARDKKWDQKPDVVAAANQARDAVVISSYLASVSKPDAAYPSDDDIQTAYDANKTRMVVPRQYQLAQILTPVPAGASRATDDDAKKKAVDLRAQAMKARADFATVVRQSTQDKATADRGGELGWLRDDELAPDIRAAVAGLQEGGISDPVRMPDGWHVLKLIGTKPASTVPLADVRTDLAEALRKQRTQQNAQGYVAGELRTQPVQIDEIALSKLSP